MVQLINVFPVSSLNDMLGCSDADTKGPRNRGCSMAGSIQFSDSANIFFCDPSPTISNSFHRDMPTFNAHVANIVCSGPAKQVTRAKTDWVITVMTYIPMGWDGSESQRECNPVNQGTFSSKVKDPVITSSNTRSVPFVAWICMPWPRVVIVNLREKILQMFKTGILVAHLRGLLSRMVLRPSLFAQRGLFDFTPHSGLQPHFIQGEVA